MTTTHPTTPRHPSIRVKLSGADGNAFAVLGTCIRAARAAGLSAAEIEDFTRDARSNDYGHLLRTCMKWFDVS